MEINFRRVVNIEDKKIIIDEEIRKEVKRLHLVGKKHVIIARKLGIDKKDVHNILFGYDDEVIV